MSQKAAGMGRVKLNLNRTLSLSDGDSLIPIPISYNKATSTVSRAYQTKCWVGR